MKKKLIAGVAGVALITGVGLSMPQIAQAETVGAQTSTPTISAAVSATFSDSAATDSAATEPDRRGRSGHGGKGLNVNATITDRTEGRGLRGTRIDAAALATKLGLPEATVSDALAAVRDQLQPATRPLEHATQVEKDAARDARHAAFTTALADELNIDEATLTTAMTELRTEADAAK